MDMNDMNKEVNRCSDADLIRSVAGGRLDAFRAVMEKYLDMVARTSYRILCDRGAADEVTCSVFMSIWNDSASYDEIVDVKAWIYRMICDFCLGRLRRRGWLDIFAVRPDVYEKSAPRARLREDDYITKETWVIFCRASRELTAEQRIAYVLCELEGVSVHEAAVITRRHFDEIVSDRRTARNRVKRELEIYGKVR